MANTQSSNSTQKQARTSGMSKIAVLPYPELIAPREAIKDVYSYVIKDYGNKGLAAVISREKGNVQVQLGDWNRNEIDLATKTELQPYALKFAQKMLPNFVNMMHSANINMAQYFFAIDEQELVLVDMQTSLNKFVGPGMIKDIFGRICETQKILKTEVIDDKVSHAIDQGTGSYEGNLIIKPSRFRLHHIVEINKYVPLYVHIKR